MTSLLKAVPTQEIATGTLGCTSVDPAASSTDLVSAQRHAKPAPAVRANLRH